MIDKECASVTLEFALRHRTGRIDEISTATTFGPMTSIYEAVRVLETAESDCTCIGVGDGGSHSLVARTVTISRWQTLPSADSGDT